MADLFDQGVQTLVNLGINPTVARGAIRYLYRNESGLDPAAVNPSSGATGLAQWLGNRKAALFSQHGSNPSADQQYAFMRSELAGPESATLARLKQASTEKQGYDIWGASYERPGSAALAKAGVKPEGYYQGSGEPGPALHLTLRKPLPQSHAPDAMLDMLLMSGGAVAESAGTEAASETSRLALLDKLDDRASGR